MAEKALNPNHMTIQQFAKAINCRRETIKKYRRDENAHPIFRKTFQFGTAAHSQLFWHRKDVEAYLVETTGHGLEDVA